MRAPVVLLAAIGAPALLALANPIIAVEPPWVMAGESPRSFEAGKDPNGFTRGSSAKYIRAKSPATKEWATLMQTFSAAEYRGKRVRFQAQVRTEEVKGWSGLWMRVDCTAKYGCAFYNSEDKPMRGTNGWTLRSVTLDVPLDAKEISFGVISGGGGTSWIDDLRMEVVGDYVAVDVQPGDPDENQLATKPSL